MKTLLIIAIIAIIGITGCVENTNDYIIKYHVSRQMFSHTPLTVQIQTTYIGISENYTPKIIGYINLYNSDGTIYKSESFEFTNLKINQPKTMTYIIPAHIQDGIDPTSPNTIIWTKLEINVSIDNKTIKSENFDYNTNNPKWYNRIENFGIE